MCWARQISGEIEIFNKNLVKQKESCLLFVFGRYSSPDSRLDVPVEWIRVFEAGMNIKFGQGFHFFNNLSSFQICNFFIFYNGNYKIDRLLLNNQNEIARTDFVRHIRIPTPLEIKVDGCCGRGIVKK